MASAVVFLILTKGYTTIPVPLLITTDHGVHSTKCTKEIGAIVVSSSLGILSLVVKVVFVSVITATAIRCMIHGLRFFPE